jgi:hypothetical protein
MKTVVMVRHSANGFIPTLIFLTVKGRPRHESVIQKGE